MQRKEVGIRQAAEETKALAEAKITYNKPASGHEVRPEMTALTAYCA